MPTANKYHVRYNATPYEDSSVTIFAGGVKYTYIMPRDSQRRYQWNEALIELLDLIDQALKRASGDSRLFVRQGQLYMVHLFKRELEYWQDRFRRWSGSVRETPDRESRIAERLTVFADQAFCQKPRKYKKK